MIRTVVNPYRMFSLSKFSFFTPLYLLIRSYQIPVFFICPLALSGVKSIFCSYFIGCILITLVEWFQWRQIVQYVSNQGRILFEIDGKPRSDKLWNSEPLICISSLNYNGCFCYYTCMLRYKRWAMMLKESDLLVDWWSSLSWLDSSVGKALTGIAEVLVKIPFRPKFFSRSNSTTA